MDSDEDDDAAAFRLLYEANFAAVYRYVARRRSGSVEVPDVVADVFAVAWRRRQDHAAAPTERAWLLGVARRVLADHRRADARRGRLVSRIVREIGDGRDTRSDTELPDRLDELIDRLRPLDREAIRLVAWDDLSRDEAAAALGCSVNALNIRLHRALRRLGHQLGEGADRTTTEGRGRYGLR
jgi:RNA polymerase sigma factor (sigma-70 family)